LFTRDNDIAGTGYVGEVNAMVEELKSTADARKACSAAVLKEFMIVLAYIAVRLN